MYMWIGAGHMLRLARESRDGQLYTCMSALIYSAFMLEAYLNHLGRLRHENWERIERRYSKRRKYMLFAEAARLSPTMEERPYSSLVRLFDFRDSMAHGRTVTEQVEVEVAHGESIASALPGAEWQQFITLENAESHFADAVALIEQLHAALGYTDAPFSTGGGGIYAWS
ncbi:hypothetical protein [Ramlibacter pallidus]|uniref:Apea-like HEPN domain-containing protein n=1 Tax=Ramlibacter pallidus TaxID=2780087 RepID=A0ABR9S2D8_9BURK|nr:hypothetical protein [Ramlibacter pallidus]MBE7367675.1 hypothetical protein [Ramlibacter pallidus]